MDGKHNLITIQYGSTTITDTDNMALQTFYDAKMYINTISSMLTRVK